MQNITLRLHSGQESKMKCGFTLVEMLVVIALLGILTVSISEILFSVIRSSTKGEITKEVKQNGDYALAIIDQMTRNASDAACTGASSKYSITNPDGNVTTIDCNNTSFPSQISSASAYIAGPTPTIVQAITNTNVAVSSCSFAVVCPTPPIRPKYVYYTFTITQKGAAGVPQQNASETYQGTVTLRNYK